MPRGMFQVLEPTFASPLRQATTFFFNSKDVRANASYQRTSGSSVELLQA